MSRAGVARWLRCGASRWSRLLLLVYRKRPVGIHAQFCGRATADGSHSLLALPRQGCRTRFWARCELPYRRPPDRLRSSFSLAHVCTGTADIIDYVATLNPGNLTGPYKCVRGHSRICSIPEAAVGDRGCWNVLDYSGVFRMRNEPSGMFPMQNDSKPHVPRHRRLVPRHYRPVFVCV
jgi:hypothetical protein